jgi:pimeloyl-ACP methyl ester carboxylesterase
MIAYHDSGSGFPIVWIHGYPLSSAVFEPQTEIAGFRHIRVDLRGFGATPPPNGSLSMSDYARDVLEVTRHLGIEKAVFAGVSMGGYIVMQILRDAPAEVAAVLLLDTRETADDEAARAKRYESAAEVEKNGTRSVVEAMLPKMVNREESRPAVRRIMESATPRGVIAALHAMATRPDSSATLRETEVPALIVVGDRDPITPPSDAERMKAMMRYAEMAPIAKAFHLANFEQPQQVNPIIAAFLTRHVLGHGRPETSSRLA